MILRLAENYTPDKDDLDVEEAVPTYRNHDAASLPPADYQIDLERGIVMFREPHGELDDTSILHISQGKLNPAYVAVIFAHAHTPKRELEEAWDRKYQFNAHFRVGKSFQRLSGAVIQTGIPGADEILEHIFTPGAPGTVWRDTEEVTFERLIEAPPLLHTVTIDGENNEFIVEADALVLASQLNKAATPPQDVLWSAATYPAGPQYTGEVSGTVSQVRYVLKLGGFPESHVLESLGGRVAGERDGWRAKRPPTQLRSAVLRDLDLSTGAI